MYTHILMQTGHPEKNLFSNITDLLATTTVVILEGQ